MSRALDATNQETPAAADTRRGRILAVGTPSAIPGLDEASDRTIVYVPNLFDAVGELCTAGPREPIDAILVTAKEAAASTTRAIQSLRRFDPAVRVIVVGAADAADELDSALREQFDLHLATPLTRSVIEAIFTGGGAIDAAQADTSNACEIEVDRRGPMNGTNGHQASTPESASPQHDNDPVSPRLEADPDAFESPAEPLGDIDLVEAVMSGPDGVRDRALELIAQQTGWREVKLLDEPTRDGIAVVHDEAFHGTLIADAPHEEVEPWAHWLGYWLSLDAAYRRNRTLSLTDELTGAWNRRYFDSFLNQCIRRAAERRRPVSVMVLDLDDFKQYNDTFGHAAGDEILRETVRLLTSVIRKGDRVCRIGGDEFAVIFADLDGPREPGSEHPQSVEQITKRFQDEICQMHFPKLGIEAPGTLSVSAGLATYPWDGHDAASLLEHADQLALESKRRGKNAITMGPGAQENCGWH